MDASKYAALFLSDSREHLQQCDALLLAWEGQPSDLEPVAGLFRAMHTIKGMAATMGYTQLAALTHDAESLLDGVRSARVPPTRELVGLMFEVVDAIGAGVEDAAAGVDGQRPNDGLRDRLTALASAPGAGGEGEPVEPPGGTPPAPAADAPGRWVTVTIRPGVVMGWARALLALRRAEDLGAVAAVSPDPATVEPDKFSGRLAFRLDSSEPGEVIRASLLKVGDVIDVAVDESAARPAATPAPARRDVRVDRQNLDRLMNEVGELVVVRNQLADLALDRKDPVLDDVLGRLSRLTDQVHEGILMARMAPVAEVFDRFPRAIRDLARQVDKQVRLEITGREIELDRAVLEAIHDPLLHLLRNAVDHGLERASARLAAGKKAEGTIRLAAQQQRDGVVVTVTDDGGGIDRKSVRARLGGSHRPGDEMDDAALLAVLARPGFSTAATVTEVSGRGVGIDVVLTRIREVGGAVSIRSTPGAGTVFTIRLPQTMAVVPTLLATAGTERYAIPLSRVQETGRSEAGAPQAELGGGLLTWRGEALRALDLRGAVGASGPAPSGVRPFLVVAVGEGRGVVVVDRLLGRQDLVVGSVDLPVGAPRWIMGASVLPDGMPAFLIDPSGLFQEEVAWQR